MSTNWEEIEKEFGNGFKDYAPDGKYTVKVASVDIRPVGTKGSIVQEFHFEETDEYKFPKSAAHWLSFKEGGDNWRKLHQRNLMMVLGATKENAQKAVDTAEDKNDKDAIVKTYIQLYERLLKTKPEVEIEVWKDGEYSTAEFTDSSVRMNRPEKKEDKKDAPVDDIFEGAEVVSPDSLDEMPF